MSKDEFLMEIVNSIKEHLPEEYQHASIEIVEVDKLNDKYTGLIVKQKEEELAPTINTDLFYNKYQSGIPMDEIMNEIANVVSMNVPEIDISVFTDYEKAKDRLFIRVSNAETNKEILAKAPHKIVEDLAISYHLFVSEESEQIGSITVTNELFEKYGVPVEQLHQDALQNSSTLFPATLLSMKEMLKGMLGNFPEGEDLVIQDDSNSIPLFVLSNDAQYFGAASLFYPDVQDLISSSIEGNYYILPSSVHECLLYPENKEPDIGFLKEMVKSANIEAVSPQEKLSDEVYHYDSVDKIFETADKYVNRVANRENSSKKTLNSRILESQRKISMEEEKQTPGKAKPDKLRES